MSTSEIWRPIPSLPEYIASSEGRLMRIPHRATTARNLIRAYGGQPTAGQWDGERYILAYRGRTYKVHRLVCEAFNGPGPFAKAVVMHLDENSRNNHPTNLAWGTQKENLNAPGFLAYCRGRTGDSNPLVKGRRKRSAA